MTDSQLLERFARDGSVEAFRELVARHTNFVYSCAVQRLRDAHAAQDVTQAVFVALAQQAKGLSLRVPLPGWLYKVTRYTCAMHQRSETRRKEREMRAFEQQQFDQTGPTAALWEELQPQLASALDSLSGADREAVLLRFYQQASHREVAAALHLNEEAAKKRVNRALDKLRRFFTKKGVTLSGTALAGVLTANAVQDAPAGLAATCAGTALGATLAAAETLMLAKGAIHMMFIAKLKTVSLAAAACLVVAGTGVVAAKQLAGSSTPAPSETTIMEPATTPVLVAAAPVPVTPVQPPTGTPVPVAPKSAEQPLRFTEADNGKTVTVKLGQKFEVVLLNGREGAGWEPGGTEITGASVERVNKLRRGNCDEFMAEKAPTPDTTLGMYKYRYNAVKIGTSIIRLYHLIPSGPVPKARDGTGSLGEFKLTVEVIADGAAAVPAVNEYQAQQLAQLWVSGLLAGRVDQVVAVSDVPFCWNRRELSKGGSETRDDIGLLKTAADLRAKLEAVVKQQGVRNLAVGEAAVLSGEQAVNYGAARFKQLDLPGIAYVQVKMGQRRVQVAIQPGAQLKVVGFAEMIGFGENAGVE